MAEHRRPMIFLLACLVPCQAAEAWGSLHDGLQAWEAFKFDTDFTYEVTVGQPPKTVFSYPHKTTFNNKSQHSQLEAPHNPKFNINIVSKTGAKTELLRNVTTPHVAAILGSQDPGATQGKGSVSREHLLAQGGGLTLPGLLEAAGAKPKKGDKWQILRDAVDVWASLQFDVNFTVNIGTAEGTLFTYTKGSTGMHTRLPGASLSKWPAALMISGLVADGTLSYDDKANKHLKWWASDPKDPRSNITLRHFLTFQSGYMKDGHAPLKCMLPSADYLTCAEGLYKNQKLGAPPGTSFAYLSCHLQFAGAMAVAATGLSPDKLFQKYLYGPLDMTETTWTPLKNPQMATGITTTGSDFEKMMHKMLSYEFLGKKVLDEMERDWSAPPVSPSGDGWFGHYGMGHWFDCIGYAAGQEAGASAPLTEFCLGESIQAGPGAYAYFPLIDRKRGYYFQIVVAEDSSCRSEIPEYLRVIAKPVVDAIIEGTPIDDKHLLSRMGGLVLREITDIYNYIPPQCKPRALEWPPVAEEMSPQGIVI